MTFRRVAAALVLALGIALLYSPQLGAQAGVQGRWTTLPSLMPINPIHIAMMHNGKVLIVAGSGNVASETNYQAAVWDPESGSIVTQPVAWDMFCNGMVILPDGRVFINGGNLQYDPFLGQPKNAVYNPMTGVFTNVKNMAHGRWYPTVTVLGDGRVMTFSGLRETGGTNTAVEFYTPGIGWSQEYPAGWTPPLYPRMHLLPDGTILYSGSGTGSRIFNPSTKTWTGVIASTNYTGTRTYGTSVLLPLTLASGYTPRVMIFGGGNPATASTETLDLSVSPRQWQYGPPMSQPRIEMNATILPNGKVLAMGGSKNNEDATTASLNADLYDPISNTFTSAGANAFPRLYHSSSLLLPDATVLLVGGNPKRGTYEAHMEAYSPAYLFNADGTEALRPTITSVTPEAFRYGSTFHVQHLGRRRHPIGRARAAGRVDPLHRHGSAAGGAGPHGRSGRVDRHVAAQRQHRTARVLHALHPQLGRGAVGSHVRAVVGHDSQSASNRPYCEPVRQRHGERGSAGLLHGRRERCGRHCQQLLVDLPWWQPGHQHAARTWSRDLPVAGDLRRLIQGHRQRRSLERIGHTDRHGAQLLDRGLAGLSNDSGRNQHELYREGHRHQRIHRIGCTQRQRAARGCHRFVQPRIHRRLRFVHAQRGDQRDDGRWNLSADDHRNDRGDHPHRDRQPRGDVVSGPRPIGIDFTGSTPVAMSASEVAGVVPMSNWNSAAGAASTVPLALLDATGTATGGTVTWTANSVWMLPTVDQPGDRRMMKGYLDSANTSTTTVSVARLVPRTYDVYVYVDGDNRTYDRPANYTLSGPGLTPMTIKVIDPASTNFSGTFTQAANAKGNYLKFNVTGGDFTLTATPEPGAGSRRAPVNALEIVPVVAAPPPPPPPGPMTISVNFVGSSTVGMDASEIAGVVAAANWNNASGAARSTPELLVDETGTSTTAAMVWTANGVWMTPPITDQPGNRRMMKGYLDTSSTSVTTPSVTGLLAHDYDGRRRGERSHSRSPARTPWLLRTTTVRLTVQ